MRKKSKKYMIGFSIVLLGILLSGCSLDGDKGLSGNGISSDGKDVIQLMVSVDDSSSQLARVATDQNWNSVFEDGDAIGVYMFYSNPSEMRVYKSNVKYTYHASTNEWLSDTTQYYPGGSPYGTTLDFYAYYPFDSTAPSLPEGNTIFVSNVADHKVSVDLNQKNSTGFSHSDFMQAHHLRATRGTHVTLNFSHIFSLLELKFNATGYGREINAIEVSIGDIITDGFVSLYGVSPYAVGSTNGMVTAYPISLGPASDGSDYIEYVARVIIPAEQDLSSINSFLVKYDGYYYTGIIDSFNSSSSSTSTKGGEVMEITGSFPLSSLSAVPDPVVKDQVEYTLNLPDLPSQDSNTPNLFSFTVTGTSVSPTTMTSVNILDYVGLPSSGSAVPMPRVAISSEGYAIPVEYISERTFFELGAARVEIPYTVKTIGLKSFAASSLSTVVFGNSVTKVAIGQFTTPTFFTTAANWLNAPWDTTIWDFVSGDYPRLLNTPLP